MVFPNGIWLIVAVSFLLCVEGFYRFVWFMSVGYGISVAGIGAVLLVMALTRGGANIFYLLQCVLFVIYGIRLGGFLLIRELKNEKYRAKAAEAGSDMKVPVFVAAFMWIFCGSIYVCQSAGPVYRLLNGLAGNLNIFAYIGIIISALGVYIEALADKQKGEAKAINPNMPAMHGLYKLCRCPNYLGEMLFWTGAIISGIGALQGAQWIVALIGYGEIMFVMISGAKRVEGRHIKHYGDKKEYQDYANSVPLLFPFTTMYHMTSPEKLAAEEAKKAAKKAKKNK